MLRGLLLLGLLLSTAGSLWAREQVYVAVATNFAEPAARLEQMFEAAHPYDLRVTTGSTGKLYAQIRHGAPFELLLAADTARPARLMDEGLARATAPYATGRLVVWSPDPQRVTGPETLQAAQFDHLALANPDLAPYGLAAQQSLQALGLADVLRDRLVMGQNAGQAFSIVATGNAALGFVPLSLVDSPRNPQPGSRWLVPAELHAPIRQDAALLSDAPGAVAFFAFLTSPQARAEIARFGYLAD